ncbi:hypothetical protein C0991_000001, partial [Blastosporella zonata]
MFSALSQAAPSVSPTASTSPSSDSSPQIPQGAVVSVDFQNGNPVYEEFGHERDFDNTEAVNSVMFTLDDSNHSGASAVSSLPYTSHHPYAVPYESPSEPTANRQSILSRRSRSSSALPPAPPPPSSSLPPAPLSAEFE